MADPSEVPPSQLPQPDLDSIEQFVRGKKKSIAGSSLRIEYIDNAIKLFDAQKTTIAISKQVSEWQQKVLLYRHAGEAFNVLADRLAQQGFLASKKSRHPDFAEYSKYQVPSGYVLQYQPASTLGQTWLERQSRLGVGHNQGPLVFQGNNWYPIQELKIERNTMHLRTLVGELSIDTKDSIVWIESTAPQSLPKVEPAPASKQQVTSGFSAPTPPPTDFPATPSSVMKQKTLPELDAPLTAELTAAWKTPILSTPPVPKKNTTASDSSQTKTIANLKETIKLKALARMVDYLNDGETIISTEVLKNGHDQIISTKTTEVKRSCPRWVIEQVRQF
jgi:hypothetical protein